MMIGTREAVEEAINEAIHALHMQLQRLHKTGLVPLHLSAEYETEDPELCATASLDLSGMVDEFLPTSVDVNCAHCSGIVTVQEYDLVHLHLTEEDRILDAYGEIDCPGCDAPLSILWDGSEWSTHVRKA